jgi:gliding motility-associated protein GldC
MKKTEIKINVTLDDNHVPDELNWSAPDGGIRDQDATALFLSTWDKEAQESARIDLWTKEMPVDQMRVFVHQTLIGIRASYLKATQDVEMGESFQQFCDYFSDELKLGKAQRTKE